MGTSPRLGHELFARYAFPPNELGYCGPEGANLDELAERAREFNGAWPYLSALGDALGLDPLDADVVRSYWLGGALLDRVDPAALLHRLRSDFAAQVTGLLEQVASAAAHHSFHVFVVYPWVRFLDVDPSTPLRILHNCRIRSAMVESVDDGHAVVTARPVTFERGRLELGDPQKERLRWAHTDESAQAAQSPPQHGELVSAHWDWICDRLTLEEAEELDFRTERSIDIVNALRQQP